MFAHPLPQYPVVKPGRSVPSFAEKGEQPPPHIPSFLPAFPDKHTYVHTPQYQGHERQPEKQAQVSRCRRATGCLTWNTYLVQVSHSNMNHGLFLVFRHVCT
jgi:transcription initiation factor TFIID subunit 8